MKREYARGGNGKWHHSNPALRNRACEPSGTFKPVAVAVADKIPTPACRSCAAKDQKGKP